MILPKEAELLGVSSSAVEIKGSGIRTVVRINVNAQDLVTGLKDTSEDKSRDGIYLSLENVRGTHDATVLNVYINLPEEASGDHRNLLAGTVGLYGLRRASIQRGEQPGLGLTFVLDITPSLLERPAVSLSSANEIHISIVPGNPLPDAPPIEVGRISIFRQRHSSHSGTPTPN